MRRLCISEDGFARLEDLFARLQDGFARPEMASHDPKIASHDLKMTLLQFNTTLRQFKTSFLRLHRSFLHLNCPFLRPHVPFLQKNSHFLQRSGHFFTRRVHFSRKVPISWNEGVISDSFLESPRAQPHCLIDARSRGVYQAGYSSPCPPSAAPCGQAGTSARTDWVLLAAAQAASGLVSMNADLPGMPR